MKAESLKNLFQFTAIGYIESCYKEKFGTPRQCGIVPESQARLKIRPQLNPQEALNSLERFSHVWLIWVFHENTNKDYLAKVHPPRLNGEKVGVFASRSPHRPNPIGLSVVKLDRIDNDTLYLSGIDLIDGTPILDVKPYLPDSESIPTAQHGWLDKVTDQDLSVTLSNDAENQLKKIADNPSAEIKKAIEQQNLPIKNQIIYNHLVQLMQTTLRLDPRPKQHKLSAQTGKPTKEEFGFFLYNMNVKFRIEGNDITVFKLELK